MFAQTANADRDGKTLCRFLMGDLLEWSTKLDDPRVHAERAALSAAYARLAAAVYAASPAKTCAFLDVYPPYGVVKRRSLDIIETAYPHKKPPRAAQPGASDDAGARQPANDRGDALLRTAPMASNHTAQDAQATPAKRRGGFAGRLLGGSGAEKRDPRLHWIDPRNGRRLG